MNYYINCFKKYADFDGRARRSEYWTFSIVNSIAIFVLRVLSYVSPLFLSIVMLLFLLATIIPTLAVSIRRLHDIGKSGIWLFISLIPIVGNIWLFILHITDSDPLTNEYGENPKTAGQTY